jgi:hypothetical protein
MDRAEHDPARQRADHRRQRRPRKLIIFTEHRDTLDYLAAGSDHCSATRCRASNPRRRAPTERRVITEEFTKNRDCQILLAPTPPVRV